MIEIVHNRTLSDLDTTLRYAWRVRECAGTVKILFKLAEVLRRPGRAEPDGKRPRPFLRPTRLPVLLALVAATALTATLGADVSTRSALSAPVSAAGVMAQFPVSGACWYTDTWQASRPGGRVHEGVDIGAAAGTPLVAVADGTIAKMYTDRPDWRGGNALRLTMADGTYFFYGHLQGFADGIAVGSKVTAGQVIGFVGRTGNAGVDHLHIEVHPGGGAPVNPYPIVKAVNSCASPGRAATPTATTASTAAPGTTSAPGATTAVPAATPTTLVAGANFVRPPIGSPGCVSTHPVIAGDYWYLIAARYSLPVRSVTAANGRSTQSFIFAGESLCLPAVDWVAPPVAPERPSALPATPAAVATSSTTTSVKPPSGSPTTTLPVRRPQALARSQCKEFYVIKPNDYWILVGEMFKIGASRVAAANGRLLSDPVHPGDEICIPR